MSDTFTKTPDEAICEILERYTITDLVEQTDADMERADELFYRSDTPIEIVGQGEENLIRFWLIRSGDKFYQVRRFKNFAWCSCKDFYFKKKMCKHLAFTTGVYCQNCRVSAAKVGKLCYDCDANANFLGKPQTENNDESSNSKN